MAASWLVAGRLYRSVAKVVREHARAGVALPHLPTSLLSAVLPPAALSALRSTPRRRQPLLDLRTAFRGNARVSNVDDGGRKLESAGRVHVRLPLEPHDSVYLRRGGSLLLVRLMPCKAGHPAPTTSIAARPWHTPSVCLVHDEVDERRLQATEAAAVWAHLAAVAASDQAGQAAGMDGEGKTSLRGVLTVCPFDCASTTHDMARAVAAAAGAVGFLMLRRMNARLALLREAAEEVVPSMNEWCVINNMRSLRCSST
jgi:hypothetical protein